MTEFWTASAALAAAVSALMAAIYTWLTYRLVRSQNEPNVVLYASGDLERPTIIVIRVANIGRDVATDITFATSRPVPASAYGLSSAEANRAEDMTDGPLIDGIPVLGPGDTRIITWGQYGGLSRALGREAIDVTISYRHGRRNMRNKSRLEVASFTGTDDSENPPTKSARMLEDISRATKTIAEELRRPYMEKRAREYWWERLRDSLSSENDQGDASSLPPPLTNAPTVTSLDQSLAGKDSTPSAGIGTNDAR